MNARIPVMEGTRKAFKDFVLGIDAADYDSAIRFLLDFISQDSDVDELFLGYRLRDDYKAWAAEKTRGDNHAN